MEEDRMELWNVKNLDPPPLLRCRSSLTQIDLDLLMNALREGIEYFTNQQYLHREAALLSRLIYRMKMKFRSSKDFKILEKINTCLLNYLQMNLPQLLKQFSASVSIKSKTIGTFLPTRNMFDYILIRFQGLGRLLIRIIDCCKIACELHNQRMRLGHFWKIAVLIYGIASRLFVISKNMIKFTCNLYTKLYSLRSKFSNIGVKWLPNNYIQPKSLNEWLGISWEELEKTVVIEIPDEPLKITSYFNLIDDDSDDDNNDDIQISDEYVLVKDDTFIDNNKNQKTIKSDNTQCENVTSLRGFDENVDVGEVFTLSDTDNEDLMVEENNTNVELENNCPVQETKEIPQDLLKVDKIQNNNTPTATIPKTMTKRVVKIIKSKKSPQKTDTTVINLDDSNEENESVILVDDPKPIQHHSNNVVSTKKQQKKRKISLNSIQTMPTKKKKQNGEKFNTNQQNNSTAKKKKKKKKKRINQN